MTPREAAELEPLLAPRLREVLVRLAFLDRVDLGEIALVEDFETLLADDRPIEARRA